MNNKTIPHKIYYFWQHDRPLTSLGEKCVRSWKKFFPDYEIVQIDETNFDVNQCDYAKVAWNARRYAYLSDYVRVKVVCDYGGVYFDLDVEVIRDMRNVVEQGSFFSLSKTEFSDSLVKVATGLGFACYKNHPILKRLVELYESWRGNRFYDDRNFPILPACPVFNWPIFASFGVENVNSIQKIRDTWFYPTSFFEPMTYENRLVKLTSNTFTIHWYNDKNNYIRADEFVYFYKAVVTRKLKRSPSLKEFNFYFRLFHPFRALSFHCAHKKKKVKVIK